MKTAYTIRYQWIKTLHRKKKKKGKKYAKREQWVVRLDVWATLSFSAFSTFPQ